MAKIHSDDLLVCIDCGDVIANGWGNFEDHYPEGYSETNARREDIQNGLNKVPGGYWALDCGDNEENDHTFSSARCDCCGSNFAGYRHGAAILVDD